MGNDALGDSAIIQRVVDIFAGTGFVCRIVNGNVDDDILAVKDLLFFDADKSAQTKVFIRIIASGCDIAGFLHV